MILNDLYHLYQAHKNSKLSAQKFLEKYKDELFCIRIGCSFNPEHWLFENQHQETILNAAKFIVEDLKIKDIRLSIRWDKAYMDGQINLDYYHELFQYFFSQDLKICLNIGPIKTMRWPEEQVPKEILESLNKIPERKSVITSNSELGIKSLNYLKELLKFLKRYFTEEQLGRIESVQADNESFNQFGVCGWTMSEKFEIKVFSTIQEYFPEKKIMINSAGRNNLREIYNLTRKLNNNTNWDKYIFGYNYYFKVPKTAKNFLLKYFDNLWIAYLGSIGTKDLKKLSQEKGFEIEISELQGEPWIGINTPGNSLKDFQYSLIRVMTEILNLNKLSIVRYWGVEDLIVKKFLGQTTQEHEKIFELIRTINSNS